MAKNPNAVIGGGSGLTGGAVVVYVLSLVGVHLDAYAGIAIASAFTGAVLWIGRTGGFDGIKQLVLHGTTKKNAAP